MKNWKAIFCLGILAVVFIIAGCKKDDDCVEPHSIIELQACFYELEKPDQPEEIDSPKLIEEIEEIQQDGIVCVVKHYAYAPGVEESLLLDPTADVIYPGSILKAGSVIDGEYTPVTAPRTPIKLSKSGTGESVTIDNPTLSSVREGLFRLSQNTGIQSANIVADITQVYSEEHLRLSINGNFKSMNANIEAGFNWQNSSVSSRFLVQFHQVYYSIDVDAKASPRDWFDTEDSDFCLNMDHMPMYVSSVKYGRVGMLMLESTQEATLVNAALNASFGNETVGGGIDISGAYQDVWSSSTFKLLLVGGSPEDGVMAVNDLNGFNQWIQNGGAYTEESPGSPIAYTLRFLDGPVASIVKSGEYSVRECTTEPVIKRIQVDLNPAPDSLNSDPSLLRVCAWHINDGDEEFDGNGPVQKASASLFIDNRDELWVTVNYHVKETDGDYTEGQFSGSFMLWKAENEGYPEYYIQEIVTPSEFSTPEEGIEDMDEHTLTFYPETINSDNFVKQFIMQGDTPGTDLSDYNDYDCDGDAYLIIDFNLTEIVLRLE